MRILLSLALAALLISPALRAADNRSPYDTNPACTDRKVDSSKDECLIKDEGTPRQKYPPRTVTPTTTGAPAKTAAPSTAGGAVLRGSAASGGR
jgi:hypothetical protein